MTKKRAGLGKGLGALLSGMPQVDEMSTEQVNEGAVTGLRDLPVDQIDRSQYQPRLHIEPEALEELAASIKAQGVMQPILVRPQGDRFELIAGERRWRAAQLAGLHEIPAVVREIPDNAAAAMALIENIQREDLNTFEEAMALQRLIEEFSMTHQQVAESVGRSRTAVSNLLRLLELDSGVQRLLEFNELDMGHARALLGLPKEQQLEAANYVKRKGLSVRETERYVKQCQQQNVKGLTNAPTRRSPDVIRLETELSEKLGAPVAIAYNNKGKGKLTINYSSLDELDGILQHIK